jgi:alpha-acetolactate decarboxylase
MKGLPLMNPVDAMRVTGRSAEGTSALVSHGSDAWHDAITSGPDLIVEPVRPIVADLVGCGRMGLGTLVAPADPMVILDGRAYRLDAGMAVCRVSPLERVRWARVVDFRRPRRFGVDHPVRGANVARLAAHKFGALPQIVAVEVSGTFSGVTVPKRVFGRADGQAVGFIMDGPLGRDWHLSFLTADRTFGGPVLALSIEKAEVQIVAPHVVLSLQGSHSD